MKMMFVSITSFSISLRSCSNDRENASKSQKLDRFLVLAVDIVDSKASEMEPEADGDGEGALIQIF